MTRHLPRLFVVVVSTCLLASCATGPKKSASQSLPLPDGSAVGRAPLPGKKRSPYAPAQEDPRTRGNYTAGGLYAPGVSDSAPDGSIDVDSIPEPDVDDEPLSAFGNRSPYAVLGKNYTVRDSAKGYDETGLASYYGNKFHGRLTSNREVYDMYAFTAAHKTLPLPSFARVTNLDNGKSVVVRVNDRGPFHDGRLIDLSYAAAVKLGIHPRGTGHVEVTGLSPGENARQDDGMLAKSGASVPSAAPLAVNPGALPPGVRIATGKPQPAPPSAIDALVNALPIGTANASERPPQTQVIASAAAKTASNTPAATAPTPAARDKSPAGSANAGSATPASAKAGSDLDWRFDMTRDGKAMSADEFDAWMKSRRARVATGKSGKPDPYGSAAPSAAPVAARVDAKVASDQNAKRALPKPAVETEVAARRADTAPTPVAPARAIAAGQGVMLQVAAFGARANAERALTMLRGAGLGEAQLLDGQSAGKPIWRLRVGPVDTARVAELSARVAGLGFGKPQVVRE